VAFNLQSVLCILRYRDVDTDVVIDMEINIEIDNDL
jgi:hypothetical protein